MNAFTLSWTPLCLLGLGALGSVIVRLLCNRQYQTALGLLSATLLCTSIVTATVALLDPALSRTDKKREIAGLVDISESMDSAATDALLEKLSSSAPSSSWVFGRRVSSLSPDLRSLESLRSQAPTLGTDRSELLKGIEEAGSSPLLLVSDGWMTGASEDEALALARSRQAPIFPLIPAADDAAQAQSLAISNLTLPFQAPAKTSVAIRTAVENSTERPQQGRLLVRDGEKTVLDKQVTIPPHEELPFSTKTDPNLEGFHQVEVSFTPADSTHPPSRRTAIINSQKRERILVLSGSADEAKVLRQVLTSQSYELSSVVAGSDPIPTFNGFSAVILNNIAAQAMGTSKLDELPPFIEKGGGLIMIGGNRSFGLGGYRGSVLEPYLPVKLLPPRAAQKKLNAAVALVIDKSNSMGELRKLDYAKEAALEVVHHLKDDDYLGVIGFDQSPFVVVKMNQLKANRSQALERIKFLYPKFGTNLVPAFDEARRQLAKAQAGRKHIIVLTDGMLRSNQSFLIQMAEEFKSEGITTSTVLVGQFQDGTMSDIARLGGGTYHQTSDPTALPRIFLADVKVNAGERTLRETADFSVFRKPTTSPITTIPNLPRVQGFVETLPQPGASPELVVNAEEGERPLLASWTRGKGRVIAFTTDAAGRWTSEWVQSPRFAQFWTDLLSAARSSNGNDAAIRYDLSVNQRYGTIELDIALYSESAARDFSAHLNNTPLTLQTIAPGHLRAIIRDPIPGTYTLRPTVGNRTLPESSFHVDPFLIGERTGQGFNRPFLKRLAEASGGLINPSPEYLNQLSTQHIHHQPLSPLLVAISLGLFLASVAVRWWSIARR